MALLHQPLDVGVEAVGRETCRRLGFAWILWPGCILGLRERRAGDEAAEDRASGGSHRNVHSFRRLLLRHNGLLASPPKATQGERSLRDRVAANHRVDPVWRAKIPL